MTTKTRQQVRYEVSGKARERFMLKVDKTSSCWNWTGAYSTSYKMRRGQFWYNGKHMVASRMSYIMHIGPIPEGKLVLHRCDNGLCVNPKHLYAGDHKQNSRDMSYRGRSPNKNKTHCINGHPYNEENTGFLNNGTWRHCLKCNAERNRRDRAIKKALKVKTVEATCSHCGAIKPAAKAEALEKYRSEK
jgi:hypothetical protein